MSIPCYDFHYPALAAFTFAVSIRDKEGAPFTLPSGGELACSVQAGESAVSAVCDFAEGVLTVRVPRLHIELPPMRRQCFYTVFLLLNGGASPLLQGQMLLDPLLPSPLDTVTGQSVELIVRDERIVLNASVCVGAQGEGAGDYYPATRQEDGSYLTPFDLRVGGAVEGESTTLGVGLTMRAIEAGTPTTSQLKLTSLEYAGTYGSAVYASNKASITRDTPLDFIADNELMTKAEIIELFNSLLNN